jgi:TolB-like protein/tetratricopeptide (TPR) repeat protein
MTDAQAPEPKITPRPTGKSSPEATASAGIRASEPEPPTPGPSLLAELWTKIREHKVVQWTLGYLALAYTLLHGAEMLSEALDWPHVVVRAFTLALMLGVPVVAVLAWYHGSRSQRRVSGGELAILSVLLAIGGYLLWTGSKPHEREAISSAVNAARPTVQQASIAVLAFADMSAGKDQEYFSDGMAEEIINALDNIDGLKVAGRTSSFSFKGKNADLKTIGDTLGVANILEGSVRKQGERVRITAQLVRANDGFHVWSDTYDGTLTDIFDLQERIAREITSRLKVVLAGGDARLVAKATDNPAAYALFVEAQGLVNRRAALPRAIDLLAEATTLDPNFARAWSKLAVANLVAPLYSQVSWETGWTAGEAAARRALALDPMSAESYAALGFMYLSERRYGEMDEAFARALNLNPNDPTALYWSSNGLVSMGRTGAAEALLDKILQTDPINALAVHYKGVIRFSRGDVAAAQQYARTAAAEGYDSGHIVSAFAEAVAGSYESAAADFTIGWGSMNTTFSKSEFATIFRGTYGDAAARAAALALVYKHPQDEIAPLMYLYLSEPARGFREFEQRGSGVSDAFFILLWLPSDYSRLARQHPSFQGFAKRLGMIDYWRKYGWPDLCHPAPGRGADAFTCD